ncbi:hypothetical protein [uncultured Bacteroides sp.]|uniref:hypothetical protein n=1 Tax=uncultured Bacteroides sp. TaxID=162156 RepID=UPI00260B29D6|nr:hypothetical protein [uncultured Bacteroides sp.]
MAYYIKVAKKVADKIGAPVENRNKTADGNILLWQADLNIIPGETIFDRAAFVGGVAMPGQSAKAEIDGTAVPPAEVTIPEYYQDKVVETPAEGDADTGNTETEETEQTEKPVTLPAGEENGEIINDTETSITESV